MSFDRCVKLILELEGEWSSHPNDHGLRTRWGISQHAYPHLDLAQLTRKDAIEIYRRDYWPCAADLHAGLHLAIFDWAVHCGVPAAVKALQHVLGVRPDGVMGPVTIAAAVERRRDPRILHALLDERLHFLLTRSGSSGQGVFLNGWMARLVRVAMECGIDIGQELA